MFSNEEFDNGLWGHREHAPVPPPTSLPSIIGPLLEMGFSFRHIFRAIHATRSSCEVNAHNINMLATWMLEHGFIEEDSQLRTNPRPNSGITEELTVNINLLIFEFFT